MKLVLKDSQGRAERVAGQTGFFDAIAFNPVGKRYANLELFKAYDIYKSN